MTRFELWLEGAKIGILIMKSRAFFLFSPITVRSIVVIVRVLIQIFAQRVDLNFIGTSQDWDGSSEIVYLLSFY